MIASVMKEKGAVVCIHDDYCSHVKTAEISQIILKISSLISNSYRDILREMGEHQNVSQ